MNRAKIMEAVRMFLEAIGEDPSREGLRDTPKRVADMVYELFGGYGEEVEPRYFEHRSDDLVVVSWVPFTSFCEHHILPFFGYAHLAYLVNPSRGVVGVSKLIRVLHKHARRLQIQERLTQDVADELVGLTGSESVMVVMHARHLCMELRGVRTKSSLLVTSAVRGEFKRSDSLKNEVFKLIELSEPARSW